MSTLPAHRARTNLVTTAADRAPASTRSTAPTPTDPRPGQSDAEIARIVADVDPLPSVRQIKATYRVGNTRAARIRAAAERHATTRATPTDLATASPGSPDPAADRACPDTTGRPPEVTGTTKNDTTESTTQEGNTATTEDQRQNPEHAPREDQEEDQEEDQREKQEETRRRNHGEERPRKDQKHHTHAVAQP